MVAAVRGEAGGEVTEMVECWVTWCQHSDHDEYQRSGLLRPLGRGGWAGQQYLYRGRHHAS